MKKEYIKPVAEAIEVKLSTMLCVSGNIGDEDATEPALAPNMEDF